MKRILIFALLSLITSEGYSSKPLSLKEDSWRKMSHRLEVFRRRSAPAWQTWIPVDRDEDGKSELLSYPNPDYTHMVRSLPVSIFEFFNFEFHSLGLFNLLGNAYINGVLVRDIRPQKGKELLISAGKGNRVVSFLFNPEDSLCQKLLLYTHTAEDSSWKGFFVPVGLYDVNDDGQKDLLTFMETTYWLYPRGVLVTDLRDGSVIWRFDTGCLVEGDYYIADLDGDGREELTLGSRAPANGAYANGIDDCHSYLIVLDLRTGKRRLIKRMGREFSKVCLLDVAPHEGKVYFTLSQTPSVPGSSFIACLSYPDTSLRVKVPLHSSLEGVKAWDFNRDGVKEFVLARTDKRDILIFDRNLNLLRQQRFQYTSSKGVELVDIADLNHDFKPEIISYIDDRITLLNSDLRPIAQFPEANCQYLGLFYNRADEPPLVLIRQEMGELASCLYFLNLRHQFVWPLPISWQATLGFTTGSLLFGVLLWLKQSLTKKGIAIRSLQRSLQLIPYGIMLLNREGKITFCNQTARKQLRLEDYLVEGRSFRRVLSDQKFQPLRQLLQGSYQNKLTRFRQTLTLPDGRGGSRELVASVTRVYDGRQKEQGRLLTLYEPPPEAWRKGDWIKLARFIAHEIRNPLSTIRLSISSLRREYQKRDPKHTPKYDRFADRVMDRIDYLEKLTFGFLKLLRLEDTNLRKCDLNKLLQEYLEGVKMGLPGEIQVQIQLDPHLPSIEADPEQVRTLVENLLTNAVKAMPKGGVLTISTSLQRDLMPPANDLPFGDYVLLGISDTGCGMSQETKEQLFQPYFTHSGGVGLGLTIVKKIVDQHRGFIEVQSEEGVGTTFMIYLPAVEKGVIS